MAEVLKQNGASSPTSTSGSETDSDTTQSAATALHRLLENLQECMPFEGFINDAANNAEMVIQLQIKNEKLAEDNKRWNESLAELVEAHEDRSTKLKKDIEELTVSNTWYQEKHKEMLAKSEELRHEKETFEERLKAGSDRVEELAGESEKLQNEVKKKEEEISHLEKAIMQENEKSSSLMKKHDELQKESEGLEAQLQASQQELEKWEEYRSGLESEDLSLVSEKITSLCYHMQGLVERFFKTELPTTFFEHPRLEALIKKLKSWPAFQDRPFIPTSDSDIAKNFRMALAFAILTELLMEHILRPTFVLRRHVIHELLFDLAELDSVKESLCRALLLSLSDTEVDRYGKGPGKFLRDAQNLLDPMLAVENLDVFAMDLRALITKAMAVWNDIQKNKTRIEASLFEPGYDDWQPLQIAADVAPPSVQVTLADGQTGPTDPIAFVLFPAFFSVADTNPFNVFYEGLAVRQSQKAAAEEESKLNGGPMNIMPAARPRAPRRGRTMSMSTGKAPLIDSPQRSSLEGI